jgi:hypothetical protein
MNKLIFLALLLVSTFAFTLNNQPIVSETVDRQLKAINWPFSSCGDGKWDIQKLTLGSTPARNQNDSIDVVTYLFYFRLVPPEPQSPSKTSFWVLNLMELHSTPKLLLSLNHSTTETPLNSNSTTLYHHLLHQELTDLLSNLLITPVKTTDVFHSNSNCDSLKKLIVYSFDHSNFVLIIST